MKPPHLCLARLSPQSVPAVRQSLLWNQVAVTQRWGGEHRGQEVIGQRLKGCPGPSPGSSRVHCPQDWAYGGGQSSLTSEMRHLLALGNWAPVLGSGSWKLRFWGEGRSTTESQALGT